MGRPPCCDKVGIKKGPWTPEEDIILVSYIQEHGPGNWRAVPTNTGLLRCSKSCRLRWTNYLRPGIKRGNFTPHEEGMIIHLQALLGNKWAAIATYLPQRTDNDIKNYWNTHLKKKLKKFHQSGLIDHHHHQPHHGSSDSASAANNYHDHFISKSSNYGGVNNNIDISSSINKHESSTSSSVYASSAENISRLLEGWMRSSSSSSPPQANTNMINNNINSIVTYNDPNDKFFCSDFGKINNNDNNNVINPSDDHRGSMSSIQCYRPNDIGMTSSNGHQLDSVLSTFDVGRNCEKSSCDSSQKGSEGSNMGLIDRMNMNDVDQQQMAKMDDEIVNPPMSFLEKWLLDESAAQVMELPSMF